MVKKHWTYIYITRQHDSIYCCSQTVWNAHVGILLRAWFNAKIRTLFPSQSHVLITVFKIKDEAVVYIITMAQKSVTCKFGDSKLGRKVGNYAWRGVIIILKRKWIFIRIVVITYNLALKFSSLSQTYNTVSALKNRIIPALLYAIVAFLKRIGLNKKDANQNSIWPARARQTKIDRI
jgi:hypothetical protein